MEDRGKEGERECERKGGNEGEGRGVGTGVEWEGGGVGCVRRGKVCGERGVGRGREKGCRVKCAGR